MKRTLLFLVFLSLISISSGQQMLLLKKPGKVKYFTYNIGDEIVYKTAKNNSKIVAVIYRITDTSLIVNGKNEVLLKNITNVYRERWGIRLLQLSTRYAGIGYLALDAINRTINNQGPVFQQRSLVVSFSMVAVSYVLYPFRIRKMTINEPWIMQALDFSWE